MRLGRSNRYRTSLSTERDAESSSPKMPLLLDFGECAKDRVLRVVLVIREGLYLNALDIHER
ncbi:hypothetical protein CY34DRAFT_799024 [Suillus luteus UH-Slu-Lm8-n1]|uniref:Uncharacterized protein n=1 Tax=Suillus luteus UH-Slu-Lm8-n1 TaxID=930992 RepID=A0A0D0ABR4_9AGAM|nr:hypothetical protein CY34DRAFT_799024 [Suillus luteus UH-Slu-Lm8-n1]